MRDTGPLSFIVLQSLAVEGQGRLERVRFARKVSFALVINGSGVSCTALDSARFREFDIGRSPDDTLDSEFGWVISFPSQIASAQN